MQSTLRSSLDSAKIATMSRLMSYASFYSRNYTGIQHVLRVIYLLGVAFGMLSMFAPRSSRKKKSPKQKSSAAMTDSGDTPKKKVAIDDVFYGRLFRLLRIIFPSWRAKSSLYLSGLSLTLLFRTIISLYVAELDGRIVASLVRGDKTMFFRRVLIWMSVAVPAVFTNSMISYYLNSLALSIRSRLQDVIQREYIQNLTFNQLT